MRAKSNSVDHNSGFISRVKYLFKLFLMNMRRSPASASYYFSDVAKVASQYRELTNRDAKDAVILEIGFGARPLRAMAFQTTFKKVYAVDLDYPVFGISDFWASMK